MHVATVVTNVALAYMCILKVPNAHVDRCDNEDLDGHTRFPLQIMAFIRTGSTLHNSHSLLVDDGDAFVTRLTT